MTSSLSVGGAAAVATEHLHNLAERLERARVECQEVALRVRPLRTADSVSRDADLADIEHGVRHVGDRLEALAGGLRWAAELYTQTERAATTAVETVVAQLAATVGLVAARLGVVLLPALVNAAIAVAAVTAVLPQSMRDGIGQAATAEADRLLPALSDPRWVSALRVSLSLVDDAALGALGVPPSLVAALGETGVGASRIDSAALAVLGLAAVAGASGTASVRIDRVAADRRRGEGITSSAPPTSLTDRVDRIPDAATPIVIERYLLADGTEHFEAYIAGTDAHAEIGGDRPWDMASNVALVAEQPASSLQAVTAALLAAGASESSSVVFTGYSQGGAIATALAESGQWSTTGLVTVGAPTGGMPVQGSYPAVVIEHRDDLVPVLSGIRRETEAVIVRGDAPAGLSASDAALPAHEIERYRDTVAAADRHGNTALQTAIEALPVAVTAGERMAFTATRVPRAAE